MESIFQLVRNGSALVRLYTGGAGRFELASHTINVELTRGDRVWVQRRESTGEKVYGGGAYNVFSAALLNHSSIQIKHIEMLIYYRSNAVYPKSGEILH